MITIPARSERQRKLAGIALSIKRGYTPRSYSPEATRMAESMSEEKLRHYAGRTKRKKKRTSRRSRRE